VIGGTAPFTSVTLAAMSMVTVCVAVPPACRSPGRSPGGLPDEGERLVRVGVLHLLEDRFEHGGRNARRMRDREDVPPSPVTLKPSVARKLAEARGQRQSIGAPSSACRRPGATASVNWIDAMLV